MKIKAKIRKQLLESTECLLDAIKITIGNYKEVLKQAKTVEQIMVGKKELLRELLRTFPLGIKHCYFCLVHEAWNCGDCEYGKVHKKCTNFESDYNKLHEAILKVHSEIGAYYQGEKYDTMREEIKK